MLEPTPTNYPTPTIPEGDEASVTVWLAVLRTGDEEAAGRLWERYFRRLAALAQRRLGVMAPRLPVDGEDLALDAFHDFCQAAVGGQYSHIQRRDELWPLLCGMTFRKAAAALTRENRLKRGGGVDRTAALDPDSVPSTASSPDHLAETEEVVRALFDRLTDPTMRATAALRMEGHTVPEIAGLLGCVPRTVERKLEAIRRLWAEE
jgi:DNA-directed RNA polymerase specialized sigma24 family protein